MAKATRKFNVSVTINKASENEIEILKVMFGDRIQFAPIGKEEKVSAPEKVVDEAKPEKKKWMTKAEYAAQFTEEERKDYGVRRAKAEAIVAEEVEVKRKGRRYNYNDWKKRVKEEMDKLQK